MTILMTTYTAESIRPLSNNERLGAWAARYFGLGLHLDTSKPRIRVVTPINAAPAVEEV